MKPSIYKKEQFFQDTHTTAFSILNSDITTAIKVTVPKVTEKKKTIINPPDSNRRP